MKKNKRVLIGLGNPGATKEETKHNTGMQFIKYFRNNYNKNSLLYSFKYNMFISEQDNLILLLPYECINLTGQTVKKYIDDNNISHDDLVFIYDDIDLSLGEYKIKHKGSSGGHNGVKDIIKYFGESFTRIKIGIGRPTKDYLTIPEWVQTNHNFEEKEILDNVFQDMCYDYIKTNFNF